MHLVHPTTGAPLGGLTRQGRRAALVKTSNDDPNSLAAVSARFLLSDRDDIGAFLAAERARETRLDFVLQAVCMALAEDIVTLTQRLGRGKDMAARAFVANLADLVRRGLPSNDAGESGEVAPCDTEASNV